MTSNPSIGYVDEQEIRARQTRELLDMLEDGRVCLRIFDGDENAMVHGHLDA